MTSAHFEKPTQVTSRYSINILCMLLLMTTLRRDLGYGVVEYVTIVNLQADVSMVVLTFSLCLTITLQKLGDTQLGSIVNKVGQKTLLVASITCAVGFLIQLASLQPSPSSASPVYTELQTAAIVSHLWPWLVMGLVWVVASVVYIYKAYRSRLMLVRKTVKILQEIDPSADEHTFEQDSAEAFLLLDVGKRGVVSSQVSSRRRAHEGTQPRNAARSLQDTLSSRVSYLHRSCGPFSSALRKRKGGCTSRPSRSSSGRAEPSPDYAGRAGGRKLSLASGLTMTESSWRIHRASSSRTFRSWSRRGLPERRRRHSKARDESRTR